MILQGERLLIFRSFNRTFPLSTRRKPAMTSAISRCPLPDTPARPRISPARTVKDRSCKQASPISLKQFTLSSSSTTSPTGEGSRSYCMTTVRPTIKRTISLALISPCSNTPTSFPCRNTVTRSATASTSFNLWVMRTTAQPAEAIARKFLNSSPASWGVSTAVGSSRIKTWEPR